MLNPKDGSQIAFGFYNDQRFRLIIDYGRDQTEGMTDADMVEAISTMYGATVKQGRLQTLMNREVPSDEQC